MMDCFEKWLVMANRWLLILMLAAMSCIIFANVVLRYLSNDSLVWAEEVGRYLMIWVTFLGAGLVLRFGGHVAIEDLQNRMPAPLGRLLRALLVALLMLFFAAMAWWGLEYMDFMQYQTTPVLGLSYWWVYLASPIGFGLLMLHLALVARRYVMEQRYLESDEIDAEAAASI
jgi:TRAP-type C4-dicarboxylate transport system permease small subunit